MIITRFHNREQLQLTVEFLTPTFLGGAEQHAELRAAPFKNLLRQWWRVAVGRGQADMLTEEGELFGSVLDDPPQSSKIRLEVKKGDGFNIQDSQVVFGTNLSHKEVDGPISSAVYLGYGPVNSRKKYISPASTVLLKLSFPNDCKDDINNILEYIDAFGTIGSRCRNGYGSITISGDGFTRKRLIDFLPQTQSVTDLCSQGKGKQYPTSLGKDDNGILCWERGPFQKWKEAMQVLAETYLELRTDAWCDIKQYPGEVNKRHILGYPAGKNHAVNSWGGNNGRMPSQLRLMVKKNIKGDLVARILHLPHRLPKQWNDKLGTELEVWQGIHRLLDGTTLPHPFKRCGGAQ